MRKAGYFKRRGWKDALFLLAAAALLRYLTRFEWALSDQEKWAKRSGPAKLEAVRSLTAGMNGVPPCFFILQDNVGQSPVRSGEVGDCLLLTPSGQVLELYEVAGGALLHIRTDLYVPDVMPLAFTRVSMPLNDQAARYSEYVSHVYDPFMYGDRRPYTHLIWQLPDGQRVGYKRVSPGSGFEDAVYENFSMNPFFMGSRINWNGNGWDVSLPDGFTYLSPEAYSATRPQQGSLIGIFDRNGNEITLRRDANGELREIKSPNGRWIRLSYNSGRLVEAESSLGDRVGYEYDGKNRLIRVRYANGHTIKYSYDDLSNQIARVEDSSNGSTVQCDFNLSGYLSTIALGDGRSYKFEYSPAFGKYGIRVTDSRRNEWRVMTQTGEQGLSYTVQTKSAMQK